MSSTTMIASMSNKNVVLAIMVAVSCLNLATATVQIENSGYFGGHFYEVVADKKMYEQAVAFSTDRERCDATGYLADVTSQEENDFVQSLLNGRQAYIGLDDREQEGHFTWVSTGELLNDFEHWASGEPDNYGMGEHCTLFKADGEWDDVKCTRKNAFVIEYSCPESWNQETATRVSEGAHVDHFYEVYTAAAKVTYGEAQAFAESLDRCGTAGYLASITDEAENDFVMSLTAAASKGQPAFIGYDDIRNEGVFSWHSGEPTSYENWAANEPNDDGHGEDCVMMNADGQWEDRDCDSVHTFVVEYECAVKTGRKLTTTDPDQPPNYNNHYYEFVETKMTYADAKEHAAKQMYCGQRGYLAVVTDPLETEFVRGFLGTKRGFIGLDDTAGSGFRWGNNEEFYWDNWASGEPRAGDCVRMKPIGTWEVKECTLESFFFIEYDCGEPVEYRAPAFAEGEYGNHFYEIFDDPMTYDEAVEFAGRRQHCGMTGYLAAITDPDENEFIKGILNAKPVRFGLTDIADGTNYAWSSGEEYYWENWAGGKPSLDNTDQNCARMKTNGQWEDKRCSELLPFIVEYDCGVAPEYRLPSVASGDYGNHHYEVFTEKMDYEDAKIFAARREHCGNTGYLAVITDPLETEFVVSLLDNVFPLIGLDVVGGDFSWVNGEEFYYENWAGGQPNMASECVRMKAVGTWETKDCSGEYPFLVEYDCGVAPVYREEAFASGEHANHFYEVFTTTRTFEEAEVFAARREFCGQKGYLAVITNPPENDFIKGLLNMATAPFIGLVDPDADSSFAWVSGEPFGYENWASGQPSGKDCVRMKTNGQWEDKPCTESRSFVVEYDCALAPVYREPALAMGTYGNHFYEVFNTVRTYEEAKAFASLREHCDVTGYLAVITNPPENDFVLSLLDGTGQLPIFGLDDIASEGTFSWINGEEYYWENWAEGQLTVDDTENCVRMRSDGMWNDVSCTTAYPFVVEYDCGIAPVYRAPALAFGEYGNHFYEVFDIKMTYEDAQVFAARRTHCEKTGYLAVLTNPPENDFVQSLLIGTGQRPYFGLEDVNADSTFEWVNGEEFDYDKFSATPDPANGEYCFRIRDTDGKWEDTSCSDERSFVVEYDCGAAPVYRTPAVASGSYGNHFYELFDHKRMNFEDATAFANKREHCGQNGYLAVITNPPENEFVTGLLTNSMKPLFGLNDIGTENEFQWVNGEEFYWENWATGQPNGVEIEEDCVRMKTNGEWEDMPCDSLFPFLVEYDCGHAPVYRAPARMSGEFNGHFYELFDDKKSYEDAKIFAARREYCGKQGYLAVITDPLENDFVEGLRNGTLPLFGLDDIQSENNFQWVNGEEFYYENWASGQPNNENEQDCVRMKSGGLWEDVPCDEERPFVVEYDCALASVYRAPAKASGMYANHFYEYFDDKMTHAEAVEFASRREHCGMSGYLAVVTNPPENDFVSSLLGGTSAFIGLDDIASDNTFTWVSGEEFYYENWAGSQPNNEGDCVRMKHDGTWEDKLCSTELPFVLEYDCDVAPVYREPALISGDFGNHFYELFENKRTYEKAIEFGNRREYCGTTGYLAVLTNPAENDFVKEMLISTELFSAFIGLNDLATDGTFEWVNGEELYYQFWKANQVVGDCVRLRDGGLWETSVCDEERPFVLEFDCGIAPDYRPTPVAAGEYGNHYYEVFDDRRTYEEAQVYAGRLEYCGKNGYLAVIRNPVENEFVTTLLHPGGIFVGNALIGLDDIATANEFTWLTGEEYYWENWGGGSPTDNDDENCARVKMGGYWESKSCDVESVFVVEYDCGEAPVYRAPAFSAAEYGNHFYEVFKERMTYEKAKEFASRRQHCGQQGYLAVSTNPPENDVIASLVIDLDANPYVGLDDTGTEGSFTWVNGEEFYYDNWAGGQPNGGNVENCMVMRRSTGFWEDNTCDSERPFVVEYDCGVAPIYRAPAMAAGEYANHFYEVFNDLKTYEEARVFASRREHCGKVGYLAVLTDPDENEFVKNLMVGTSPYIGLYDVDGNRNFMWENSEALNRVQWQTNSPTLDGGRCVRLKSNGKWYDTECDEDRSFVVEYDCGVAPIWRLKPDDAGDYGNHHYEAYYVKKTYEEAKAFAEASVYCEQQGYLTTISHMAENQFVTSKLGGRHLFIGLADIDNEGAFTWQNGEPYLFDNWKVGQPNNWGSGQDCTKMNNNGYWEDEECDNFYGFVVEYDCGPAPPEPPPSTMVEGEYGNHYYKVYDIQKGFLDAKWFAEQLEHCGQTGYLTVIDHQGENEFIHALVAGERPHIGLSDLSNEGDFTWVNGDALDYENWAPNEPNNHGTGEHCVQMRHNGQWSDTKCSRRASFVVEFDCGTAPPYLGPPPVESGYFGNHYYEVYDEGLTYSEAVVAASNKEFCGQAGYLVTITSSSENTFLAAKLSGVRPWIGMDDMGEEGTFLWRNEEEVTFEGWAKNEPSNSGSDEDCVQMGQRSPAKWNDQKCSNKYGYIVEYDCGLAPPAPLICDGPTGLVWGDPHMVTYDGLRYDCQGEGEFVIARSLDSHFEVQGRFVDSGRPSVKVTRSVAFNTGEPGVPTIQVDVPENLDAETCPFTFFVDKVEKDILTEGTGHPFQVVVSQAAQKYGQTVIFRYPETGTRIEVNVRRYVNMGMGCVMTVQVCLPSGRFGEERVVGLLGSPNNVKDDDWMDGLGAVVDLSDHRRGKVATDYCQEHWCITQSSDSLFVYQGGKAFSDYNHCDTEYVDDGLLDELADLPKEIKNLCDGNVACEIEGAFGGYEAALAAIELLEQMEEIRNAPPPDPVDPDFSIRLAPPAPQNGGYWGNHYYEVYMVPRSYADAVDFVSEKEFCGQPGYLAAINQEGENNFLLQLLDGTAAWIGFDDLESEGVFEWQSGEPLSFVAWAAGEPSGSNDSEDCVVMGLSSPSRWSDTLCSDEFAFIVEYDCGPAPPAPEAPLICDGPTGTVWGDPHVTTFDKLKYDCQGEGEFILATSLQSDFEIQGRFVEGAGNSLGGSDYPVKVTKAVVWNTGEDGSPTIQVTVPDYPIDGKCPYTFHVNGVETDVLGAGIGFPEHVSVTLPRTSNYGQTITFRYVQTGTRIELGVRGSRKQGCVIAAQICLPPRRFEEETIIGLLGSPDKNKTNDWMTPWGEEIPVSQDKRFKDAYDYCVENWCLSDPVDSMFVYPSGSDFYDYNQCNNTYDSPLEEAMNSLPDDIKAKCEDEMGCDIDGLIGGGDDAEGAVELEEDMYEIKLAPPGPLVDEGADAAVPIETCELQAPCMSVTVEKENDGSCIAGGSACQYRVCLTLDYTSPGCAKGEVDTLSHSCKKDDTACMDNPFGAPGSSFDGSSTKIEYLPTNDVQCQIAGPMTALEFLLLDGMGCEESGEFSITGYGDAKCEPTEVASCSGDDNIGKDCVWTFRTPDCNGEYTTLDPTQSPSGSPTNAPTSLPSIGPTGEPTTAPSADPSAAPSIEPTGAPSSGPTAFPTDGPTVEPLEIDMVCECLDDYFSSPATGDYSLSSMKLTMPGGGSRDVKLRKVDFSHIDAAVVEIGNTMFEVSTDGYYVDGVATTLPTTIRKFPITEETRGSTTFITMDFGDDSLVFSIVDGSTAKHVQVRAR